METRGVEQVVESVLGSSPGEREQWPGPRWRQQIWKNGRLPRGLYWPKGLIEV